ADVVGSLGDAVRSVGLRDIVATLAGEVEVADELVVARLVGRPAAGGAVPVVEDVVAEVVVRAGADFAPDAREPALEMRVEVMVDTDLGVGARLKERAERVPGVDGAGPL